MKKAEYNDKALLVDILSKSFESNKSVNYIVKQDEKRLKRIKALMDYSFEVCYLFGDVLLSDNNEACALVLYPDKKKTTIKSIMLDVNLILSCIGIENIKKTLNREAMIKKIQSKVPMYYLWFIGVDPSYQGSGIGSTLMNELIQDSLTQKRNIYLETSTLKNLPWYKKFGFEMGYNFISYKLLHR